MTKNQYIRITQTTARIVKHLPGGAKALSFPTYLCGAIYLASLAWLIWHGDSRWIRAAAVPAVSFLTVTAIRPILDRKRPYDAFQIPPVGKWEPGKGKSMPSRHTVSAVAIAIAVMVMFPNAWVCLGMTVLGAVISALRVASGQHYPSDVAAAAVLAILISFLGYRI